MAYLDHAATTAMSAVALEAMARELPLTGNASSLHSAGRRARRVVEESRELVAESLGADPGEVVFTSGGTEADNLAVKGLYWSRRTDGRRRLLVSAVEHHAVLDAVDWLAAHEGAVIEEIPVDRLGRIDVDALAAMIERDPGSIACITVMTANNEVGTLQPIADVVALAAPHGIPVHADAVQSVGKLPTDFHASGLAALSVSGHKLGAAIGVGALLLGRAHKPVPVLHGGGQERDVRSGTLATALIAGFGVAVADVVAHMDTEAPRLRDLRDHCIAEVLRVVPDAILNGDAIDRLPSNVHFSFPGCEGDSLLMLLDARGVQCSTGSACNAGIPQPSHVLVAMGVDPRTARGSLRFSFGRTSTRDDVAALVAALPEAVARARRAGLVSR